MKFATLITICFTFLATVVFGQMGYNQYNSGNSGYSNHQAEAIPPKGEKTVIRKLIDPASGIVSAHVPLPLSWKISGNKWTGPNNSALEVRMGGSFSSQQRNLYHIDQIIQQDLLPQLQNYGVQINNIIDLPQIAMNDKATFARYWKVAPSRDMHQVKGIEITDPKAGERGMVIVHFTFSQSQYGNYAHYYMHTLAANQQGYEHAKSVAIYALAKIRVSDQSVAIHNRKEQQKSQASWASHNNRMRANQRNFDGYQKAQADLSSVGDIYFEGWKSRNASSDRMQEKAVDGIWEQESVTNPYSGQQGKVESGYKYYYINGNGQYFGTNDEFYNPAQDPNMNHMEWRKVNGGN